MDIQGLFRTDGPGQGGVRQSVSLRELCLGTDPKPAESL